jgi:hypothetical protein
VKGLKRPVGGVLRINYGPGHTVQKVQAELFGMMFKEGNVWVSYCPQLDLSSGGDTKEEAQENLLKVVKIFFDECVKRGTLEAALGDLGWACETPTKEIISCKNAELPDDIPSAFIIDKIGKGKDWRMTVKSELQ